MGPEGIDGREQHLGELIGTGADARERPVVLRERCVGHVEVVGAGNPRVGPRGWVDAEDVSVSLLRRSEVDAVRAPVDRHRIDDKRLRNH